MCDEQPCGNTTVGSADNGYTRRRVQGRWAWTEPAVWTERMLTALEQGVKGGVWFSLIDKVLVGAESARQLQQSMRTTTVLREWIM